MDKHRRQRAAASLLALALTASLASGLFFDTTARAQTRTARMQPRPLREQTDAPFARTDAPEQSFSMRDAGPDKVSPELKARTKSRRGTVQVILQLRRPATARLTALLKRAGVHVKKQFGSFNATALDIPAALVEELAAGDEVEAVSYDRPVAMLGHIVTTTGAEAVRTLPAPKGSGTIAVDGTGIGIAVLDSGVYASHLSLRDAAGGPRTVFYKDFTNEVDAAGQPVTSDIYGHGTHVAATAAGNEKVSGQSGTYAGIAPNATLVNLRVLNSKGIGTISSVMAALDWVMTSGNRYKIRVVNMSLGTPAIDSYKNDPLCKAVRRLTDAGIVVVAAAGNDGKESGNKYGANNTKTYGRIHSPGNEPSAITVGATNTFGTDARSDDSVATYSSRGPTRSYWIDASGTKHYDNLVKPDLVAPGNRIVSAEALDNYLVTTYPTLDAQGSNAVDKRVMYMSGTSVSAPVVAGAAALMLQVNPNLTPNMVKMILMYTAQPLVGFNMLEQGAGQLNIDGAVRLAQKVRTDLKPTTALGASLLSSTAPAPRTTLLGFTFPWAQGVTMHHTFVRGGELITKYQKAYAKGYLLGDGITESYDTQQLNLSLMTNGIMMSDSILTSDGSPLGGGSVFMSTGIMMSDGSMLSDGIMMADGLMMSDGIYASDGLMMSDHTAQSLAVLVNGDETPYMR